MRRYWEWKLGIAGMWWFPVAAVLALWTLWTQTGPESSEGAAAGGTGLQAGERTPGPAAAPPQRHIIQLGNSVEAAPASSAPAQPETPAKSPALVAPPAPSAPPPAPEFDPDRLASIMQAELKRLGCYHGKVDNLWGRGSRGAFRRFIHTASLDLESAAPSAAAIAALRGYADSVECQAFPMTAKLDSAGQTSAAAEDRSYLPPWMRSNPATVETAPSSREPVPVAKSRRGQAVREAAVRVRREPAIRTHRRQKKAVAGVLRHNLAATLPGWPGWFGD